jgi:putative transposase
MNAVLEVAPDVGVSAAYEALGVSKASFYRAMRPEQTELQMEPAKHHRSLTAWEKTVVLETLNSHEFRDKAPIEVYASLLDKELYCAWFPQCIEFCMKTNRLRSGVDAE